MLAAVAKCTKRTLFDEPYISLASSSNKSKNKKPKNTQFLQVCIRNSGWKCLETHGPLGTMSPCLWRCNCCKTNDFGTPNTTWRWEEQSLSNLWSGAGGPCRRARWNHFLMYGIVYVHHVLYLSKARIQVHLLASSDKPYSIRLSQKASAARIWVHYAAIW